jgi:drug/metabolite transporter (DMT)-like permease
LNFFKYLLGGCLILIGVVLLGRGVRLAGGDLGTPSVPLGLLVSILGVELVVWSYAMVRRLPFEMGYRTVIYLILLWACMPLVVALFQITRFGFPRGGP